MAKPLKSFRELPFAPQAQPEPEERDLFEKIKGKYHLIRRGTWNSTVPGISRFVFIPTRDENSGRFSVNVAINYEAGNKDKTFTLSLFEDGALSGEIPRDCAANRDQLKREVYTRLDKLKLEFWHEVDTDILPDKGQRTAGSEFPGKKGKEIDVDREERLEFMLKQPEALFGFMEREGGFDGYHGIAFEHPSGQKGFIILETGKYGNAAYIVDIPQPIAPAAGRPDPNTPRSWKREDINEVVKRVWDPIGRRARTRKGLREHFGAQRIYHTRAYQERLKEEIRRRLESEM